MCFTAMAAMSITIRLICLKRQEFSSSVGDPDPEPDPQVYGPPGSGSGSINQRYGSGSSISQRYGSGYGSFPFLINVLIGSNVCKIIF